MIRVYTMLTLLVGSSRESEWAPRAQKGPIKTVSSREEACSHVRLVLQLPNWKALRNPDPPVASAHLWRDAAMLHARLRTLGEMPPFG